MIRHIMLRIYMLVTLLAIPIFAQSEQQIKTEQDTSTGAKEAPTPNWFKTSFLDFTEDVAEAAKQNKRLIVYFAQDGCFYCNLLITDNFSQPDIIATTQKYFDLVMLNIWGDREVIHANGQSFTEKELAEALNVNFTPTMLFFDENRNVVLRLDGYYPPQQFRLALAYVYKHQENKIIFSQFLALHQPTSKKGYLNRQDWIMNSPLLLNRIDNNKPLLVLFEQKTCKTCDYFHQQIMAHNRSKELISGFNVAQLDRFSDSEVVTPDGQKTTAKRWAETLDVRYSPSLIFFDENGKQVMRADAFFEAPHLQGVMAYVLTRSYITEPNFQRYLREYTEDSNSTDNDADI